MENKGNKSRTFILLLLFLILSVTAMIRLISLSIERSEKYSDPFVSPRCVRGTIYDRHGNLLAFDTKAKGFLVLDPTRSQQIASVVSRHTALTSMEISRDISEGTLFFPFTDEETESEIVEEIVREDLVSALTVTQKRVRNCPYPYMKNIIGASMHSESGNGGIEEKFNLFLSAVPALNTVLVKGEDLVLTIDRDWEKILCTILGEEEYDGKCALLNKRGEIIAWCGEADDAVLDNICYSHSTSEETILFTRTKLIDENECTSISSFRIWMDKENEKALEKIRKAIGD